MGFQTVLLGLLRGSTMFVQDAAVPGGVLFGGIAAASTAAAVQLWEYPYPSSLLFLTAVASLMAAMACVIGGILAKSATKQGAIYEVSAMALFSYFLIVALPMFYRGSIAFASCRSQTTIELCPMNNSDVLKVENRALLNAALDKVRPTMARTSADTE